MGFVFLPVGVPVRNACDWSLSLSLSLSPPLSLFEITVWMRTCNPRRAKKNREGKKCPLDNGPFHVDFLSLLARGSASPGWIPNWVAIELDRRRHCQMLYTELSLLGEERKKKICLRLHSFHVEKERCCSQIYLHLRNWPNWLLRHFASPSVIMCVRGVYLPRLVRLFSHVNVSLAVKCTLHPSSRSSSNKTIYFRCRLYAIRNQ